jgi:predicted dehydrogenase
MPYKVLIVGCGGIANHWLPAVQRIEKLRIAGLVDLNMKAAKALTEKHDLGEIFLGSSLEEDIRANDPDMVFDLTTPAAHHEVVTTALNAGCHVLGEKPMAESMEQAVDMLNTARNSKKLYAVIQNYRYNKNICRVKHALKAGLIGQVHSINADFFVGAHFDGFRTKMDHVLLLDMAIHPFDMARFLTDVRPLRVFCHEYNPPGSWYQHGANTHVIFEMSHGVVFNFRGSWCAEGFGTGFNSHWRIIGTEGTLIWKDEEITIQRPLPGNEFIRPCETIEVPEIEYDERMGGHEGLIRDFVHSVESGLLPMTHCEDNIHSLAMVMAAVESAKTGQPFEIKIPLKSGAEK